MRTQQKQRHAARAWKFEQRKKRKRSERRKQNHLDAEASDNLARGYTPHWGMLVGWASARDVSRLTWYHNEFDIISRQVGSRCAICGARSNALPRWRWLWVCNHAEEHAKKLGVENVAAFESLLSMRRAESAKTGMWNDMEKYREVFLEVFGPERAKEKW